MSLHNQRFQVHCATFVVAHLIRSRSRAPSRVRTVQYPVPYNTQTLTVPEPSEVSIAAYMPVSTVATADDTSEIRSTPAMPLGRRRQCCESAGSAPLHCPEEIPVKLHRGCSRLAQCRRWLRLCLAAARPAGPALRSGWR